MIYKELLSELFLLSPLEYQTKMVCYGNISGISFSVGPLFEIYLRFLTRVSMVYGRFNFS